MPLRTACPHCHTRLTVDDAAAGRKARCAHCEQPFFVRPKPDRQIRPAGPGPNDARNSQGDRPPSSRKAGPRLALGACLAGALLFLACVALYLLTPSEMDSRRNALKSADPQARERALAWLAAADPQDAARVKVTADLEALLLDGEAHPGLAPDLVLRAYLHWAGPDNVPALIRLVRTPPRPSWYPGRTGLAMLALGKLRDPRAGEALAEKLPDPLLHDQAVTALELLGSAAQPAVLDYLFDPAPATRLRARQVLADYGTSAPTMLAAALGRLRSGRPDLQLGAARWFAEEPPAASADRPPVARALAGLLESLSPQVNAQALSALKLWATRDSLPPLLALARREAARGTAQVDFGDPALIDVLAQFPDEGAAAAIALQLRSPSQRGRAAQALLKLGPVANGAVLGYLNDPDPAARDTARALSLSLGIAAARQLDQTLADLAAPSAARVRAALQSLTRLRPDGAGRAGVARALNALALDPDPGTRADALNALAVWGSPENTAALLRLLEATRIAGAGGDPQVIALLGALKDPAAAPALAQGLTSPRERGAVARALQAIGPGAEAAVLPFVNSVDPGARFAASRILAVIGTPRSLEPLDQATRTYYQDGPFLQQAQLASQQIAARN